MFTRKIVISFWLLVISLFISPVTVFAQTATPSILPTTISPTSPAYTDLFVHNMFHTFSCLTIGASIIGQPCVTYQLQKNAQGVLQSVPTLAQVDTSGGTLGTMTSLVGVLFANRPVRTVDYLATVGTGLGIVKEAHAQVVGSGNAVLNPIISLWQVSRNVSYLIMIIIFIVIGLMVMFRQKINPQTVITAQAALPGLVIGLIMITFSYFLAGLVVDLSFVGIDLVGYYFQTAQNSNNQIQISQELGKDSILSILPKFIGSIKREQVNTALDTLWDQIRDEDGFNPLDIASYGKLGEAFNPFNLDAEKIIRLTTGAASYQFGATVGPALGKISGFLGCFLAGGTTLIPFKIPLDFLCGIAGEAAGTFVIPGIFGVVGLSNPPFVISFIVTLAIIFIMLYVIGKLFLRLLNTYLSVVFYTLTAPFHFLIAALPGRQATATNWIKGLLGNVLAFPAVAAGIYFSAYLLGSSAVNLPGNSSQLDIFGQAHNTLPLLGGLDLSFLRVLLAFGAFVALPAIPDVILKSIGVQGGGIMGLFSQEIQGNIGAGRGQQAQFGRSVGAMGTDIMSYKKKLYENPYEPRGIFAKWQSQVKGPPQSHYATPSIQSFKELLSQTGEYIRKGRQPQAGPEETIEPAQKRETT